MKPFVPSEILDKHIDRTAMRDALGAETKDIARDLFAAHRARVREELIALKEWARGKTEFIANIDIDAFMDREDGHAKGN